MIAVTGGEPSGIASEVIIKALLQPIDARIIVIADADWLAEVASQIKVSIIIKRFDTADNIGPHKPGEINVLHTPLIEKPLLGKLNTVNAPYVLNLLTLAHQLASSNQVDAIVTAPVHKGVINDAGISFSGHTEFFAAASSVNQVVMMLASEIMRVALVTTHIPLEQVAKSITSERLSSVLTICYQGLRQLGITTPKICVLGLNPHAGEQGHLGSEELTTINPVIEKYRSQGESIIGPLPADTAFNQSNLASTDLFLAMYHDQGLPVIKYASFGKCANVTLGLPYLRTSVDHGTALDIADKFCASESSMLYALQFVIKAIKPSHH
ncbi:MAG: 4-hydroxythreonine-4-phosphate dehydrogenase PdxA [Gammaproteobacteria bacterium]|nr:4-hydroxythreonine-4-phosphate dehydrogenase PdxA [Gammaproteobacteria bacterium]